MKTETKFKKYNSDIMIVMSCFILFFLLISCTTGNEKNTPVVVTQIEPITITDEIICSVGYKKNLYI